MIDFEPNHWARVRQITLVKCTRKLNEQQAQISQVSSSYSCGVVQNVVDGPL